MPVVVPVVVIDLRCLTPLIFGWSHNAIPEVRRALVWYVDGCY